MNMNIHFEMNPQPQHNIILSKMPIRATDLHKNNQTSYSIFINYPHTLPTTMKLLLTLLPLVQAGTNKTLAPTPGFDRPNPPSPTPDRPIGKIVKYRAHG